MKKIKIIIYAFQIFFLLVLFSLIGNLVKYYDFSVGGFDYEIYMRGLKHFLNHENYYVREDLLFVYFPSFFILWPLLVDINIYILFLSFSAMFSVILLIKLKEQVHVIVLMFLIQVILVFRMNIDPFIFFVLLICLYFRENDYIPPILLGFISFKPSLILVIPFFLFNSKNRLKFIMIYGISFCLFNLIIESNISIYFDFINYGIFHFGIERGDFIETFRPIWIYYVYYFYFQNKEKINFKYVVLGKDYLKILNKVVN